MVLFNYSTKELTAKIVYYGPGLCGKTTNLQWVHEKIPIKNKGKMLSLATEADRTLFFDFLPIDLGTIRGMKTRVQLYTVPGQVFYNATRRMVLKGADCVVFVADSQEAMIDANLDSLANMRENLEANEIDPDQIPVVIQYNKRDLPNAAPVELLNQKLNPNGWPWYEAIAMKGQGVEETLKGATALVFKALSTKYGPSPKAVGAPRPAAAAPAPPAPAAAAPPPAPVAPPAAPVAAAPEAAAAPSVSADDLLDSLEGSAPAVAPADDFPLDDITAPVQPAVEESSPLDEIAAPEPAANEFPLDELTGPAESEDAGSDQSAEVEPELDLEDDTASATPIVETSEPATAEPEIDLDAAPELDLDAESAADPVLELEAQAEDEATSDELDLEEPSPDPEPELDLDATPEAPEPTQTLPPSASVEAPAGPIRLDVSVSAGGGPVTIPVEISVGRGASRVQLQIELHLDLKD